MYGASGLAGASLCAALRGAGFAVRLVGRDRARLERAAAELGDGAPVHVARADDRGALAAAFVGAQVVVNAAGPFATLGEEVVASAIACGCHYLDLCAEQAVLRRVFERRDAEARRAEVAVVPGAAFSVALGDLLAARAAAELLEHRDDGPTVRHVAAPRLRSAEPLALSIGYLFEDLTLPPGAQASVFANLHAPLVAWRHDRWDPERPGRRQRTFNPGPFPGEPEERASYEREAFSLGAGDNLTIPRHVAAESVDTYLSVTRQPGVHRALRLTAMVASLLPPQAASVLVPFTGSTERYAATRFAVVASAELPFAARHAIALGRDLYATSTELTARLAAILARRPRGPVGVLAPAEVVRAPAFLDELARDGVLALR